MDFICKTCNKSFNTRTSLWRHGQIHKEVRIKCPCGLTFSRRDSLNRHQLMLCTPCNQTHTTPPKDTSVQTENCDGMEWDEKIPKIVDYDSSTDNEDNSSTHIDTRAPRKQVNINAEDDVTASDSTTPIESPTPKKRKIKSDSSQQLLSSESESSSESDSSTPIRKKHRLHRLRKLRMSKLRESLKSKKQSLPPKPENCFDHYGIDPSVYGRNIVRQLEPSWPRFAHREGRGVGVLGQLLGI
jgi:Zinc finger, C2H2 type